MTTSQPAPALTDADRATNTKARALAALTDADVLARYPGYGPANAYSSMFGRAQALLLEMAGACERLGGAR